MILSRYLARQIFAVLWMVIAILLCVLLTHQVTHYLHSVLLGELPVGDVFKIVVGRIPVLVGLLLPFAFYLSVVWVLSRLQLHHEWVAMSACGVSLKQVIVMVMRCSLWVVLVTGVLMVWVQPKVEQYRNQLLAHRASSFLLSSKDGQFQYLPHGVILYIQKFSHHSHEMQGIFLVQPPSYPHRQHDIWVAQRAVLQPETSKSAQSLVLFHGCRYQTGDKDLHYRVVCYHRYTVPVPEPHLSKKHQMESQSTAQLWSQQWSDPYAAAIVQWRLSAPFSALILGWLAVVLLPVTSCRRAWLYGFLTMSLYVVYLNMLFMGRSWLQNGLLSPYLGLWWVHTLWAAVAIVISYWRRV